MKQSELCKIFKAFSNEQRLNLFLMIYKAWSKLHREHGKVKCQCLLTRQFTRACEKMNLSRSTVSHHFKELELAGLISCEREGQAYVCKVNEKVLNEVRHFLP